MKKTYLLLLIIFFWAAGLSAQLIVDTSSTAAQLAQKLVGTGVTISNPVLNCSPSSSGKFSNGGSTQLGISDGIMLTNGTAVQIDSAYDFLANSTLGWPGDNDLDNLLYSVGALDTSTHDACVLEFDVNPLGDTLSFTYVFGSEEYQDYTCSMFTDVFGFFISGPKPGGGNYANQNIALIPGTNLFVAINSVNGGLPTDSDVNSSVPCLSLAYSQYFRWDSTICYSGSTVPLKARAAVLPCHSYHLKLAVADVSDGALDTGVFIEGGSLSSNGLPTVKSVVLDGGLSYLVRSCANGTITLHNNPPSITPLTLYLQLGGTAVNGTDYAHLADSIVFAPNDSIATIAVSALSYAGAQSGKTLKIYLLSNSCGSLIYDSVTLTIQDSLTLMTGPDVSICAGDTVRLNATGVPSCQWTPAAGLSNSNVLNPLAQPTVSTTYIASYTVGTCVGTDSTRVTVSSAPNAGPDDTVCIGNPGSLAATGSGSWTVAAGNPAATVLSNPSAASTSVTGLSVAGLYTYIWAVGQGCADTAQILVSAGPILSVPNASVCVGGSVTLTATPSQTGGTYLWSPGGQNTQSITVSPATLTTYTVTYNIPLSNCASVTATDTVSILPPPTLAIADITICPSANGVLTAVPSVPGGTYSWSPGGGVTQSVTVSPVTNSTYTVIYALPNCLPVTDSGSVTIAPQPSVSITGVEAICAASNGQMTAVPAGGTAPYTYAWNDPLQTTSAVLPSLPANASYTVTVTDHNLCTATVSGTVTDTVTPRPIAAMQSDITCHGYKDGYVSLTIPNCNNCLYHWSNNSDSIAITNLTEGTYIVTVTDANGCLSSASFTISDPAPASLTVLPHDTNIIEYSPLSFISLFGPYPASSIVSYSWTPSAGLSCSDCAQPAFSSSSGSYNYSLVITYNGGCMVSDTVHVIVTNQHILYVPNAFTPNGDGVNDIFQVYSKGGIKYINLTIFNRWGEKVFESEDMGQGWDGRYKSQLQEPSVFVYLLQVTFDDDYSVKHTGSLTLVR